MQIDIGIDETARHDIAGGLGNLLGDTYTLYLKTHGFHWNVTGPMFQTLHLLFEEQYNEMWMAIDVIAERIRSLGDYAPGSGAGLAALASLEESDGVPSAKAMIRELVDGHETVIRTARKVVPIADAANDESTVDLLTQRLQFHEKTAWMLRSLLEDKAS